MSKNQCSRCGKTLTKYYTTHTCKLAKFISGGILAACYMGNSLYRGTGLLVHSYRDGELKTLCGRIKIEHLADGDEDKKPTCERCLAKDFRFIKFN